MWFDYDKGNLPLASASPATKKSAIMVNGAVSVVQEVELVFYSS